ncbi:isopentenyl-diphosphate Delta-isomerase [Pedobacter sp. ASV12]|uniref:isopentenyl-diphosphate Delta-isomerase n=1 Tax=Pedobacter sp. ASV12 TaxID=2795120 RepID=UPI0018EA8FF0|nr:isopentenyl-diphosphate Delta-isomerase [Pedobacter sp. ASV12]
MQHRPTRLDGSQPTDRGKVVLVNKDDNPIGEAEKIEAHRQGLLHRAFSVFIFNERRQMLLQQRASDKYHGAGLWTNACCSHPQLHEDIRESASERLSYEMGLSCSIKKLFSFIYHAPVENGLIEHEYDHVFYGFTSSRPVPNPNEVQDYKWMETDMIATDIRDNPANYTYWFRSAFHRVVAYVEQGG